MEEKIKEIPLDSGNRVMISVSEESSVSVGQHLIAHIVDSQGNSLDHISLNTVEKARVFAVLMRYLQEQHPDGNWTIMLNGPGLTTAHPTFCLHGTLPEAPGQTLCFVFNPSAYLEKLKKAVKLLKGLRLHPVEAEALDSLVSELENNLK